MADQLGVLPERLKEAPELPHTLAYVWDWFLDLNSSRQHTMEGEAPISYLEIDAWIRVTRVEVSPWEVALIRRLDKVRFKQKKENSE